MFEKSHLHWEQKRRKFSLFWGEQRATVAFVTVARIFFIQPGDVWKMGRLVRLSVSRMTPKWDSTVNIPAHPELFPATLFHDSPLSCEPPASGFGCRHR